MDHVLVNVIFYICDSSSTTPARHRDFKNDEEKSHSSSIWADALTWFDIKFSDIFFVFLSVQIHNGATVFKTVMYVCVFLLGGRWAASGPGEAVAPR